MTTLRVVLDPLVGAPSIGGRYAERLTRALVAHAPDGSVVSGVISAIPDADADAITASLPGLSELHRTRLARRELRAAWQHGITVVPGAGLLHATDLVAPLSRHDRTATPDSQTVVTVHDSSAWTRPSALDPREASRRRAMGARAARYADAIVVPTHAVASVLDGELGVGDRIRVIAAAPRPGLRIPDDADALRADLGLPQRYVASVLPDDAAGWDAEVAALLHGLPSDVHLVLVAPGFPEPGADSDASERRTLIAGAGDRDLAALLAGSSAYVDLGVEAGFGLPLLEAMAFGIPVVHRRSDDREELLADAGLAADADDSLADAVRSVLEDQATASRLATLSRDRAGAFTWRDAAEKVWQLHADL